MLMWLPACLSLQLVEPAWLLLGSVWALLACLRPTEGTHQTETTTISLKHLCWQWLYALYTSRD